MSDGRSFIVRTPDERHRLAFLIDEITVDPSHPLEIKVRRYKARRSASQNARYWAILHEIAAQTGHTPDELHEHCKATFIGVHRYEMFGRVLEVPMSSTELNTTEFSDYSTRVEEWAVSEFSVRLSAPEGTF